MADADALARLRQFVSEGETPAPGAAKQATAAATEPSETNGVSSSSDGNFSASGVSYLNDGVPDFSSWPNEPIPLISPEMGADGVEVLTVNAEALAMLRRIPVAVSVLAVSGLYRTGKSSLLNWLVDPTINKAYDLNTSSAHAGANTDVEDEEAAPTGATDSASILGSGFAVGATVQRCTRGIWIWGRPRAVTLRDGSVGALLVLDTEGLGGLESEGRYDARIFALATLLCSTLAYNSLGTIDEKAIGSLSFIAELSRNIKVTGEEEDGSSSGEKAAASSQSARNGPGRGGTAANTGLQQFFPEFCWIVRDFALELVTEAGEPMTSDEYLEAALQPQGGFDASTVERNTIRRAVTSYFSTRRTVTLVRPLSDERRLQKVDEVPFEELRPEFRRDFAQLQDALLSRPLPKTLGGSGPNSNNGSGHSSRGRPLTGPMYATLVEEYARAVSGPSGVPVIATAWESVAAQEVEAAAADAAKEHANALAALGTDAPPEHFENVEGAFNNDTAGDGDGASINATAGRGEPEADPAVPSSAGTFLPRDQAEGAVVHARAYAKCLKLFDTRADGSAAASARQALETTMTAAFHDWSTRNAAASQQASQRVLSELYTKSGLAALEALPTHVLFAEATTGGAGEAGVVAGDNTGGSETVNNSNSSSGAAQEDETHPLADPKEGPALLARLFGQLTADFNRIANGSSSSSSSSLGPRASAELAAFLAVKWPLLSARCAAAAHAAQETEAAKVDAVLADTKRRVAAAETRDGARNGDAAAKDSEVSALRLEVAKLGAQADGTSARQAVLEQQRVEAQKRASDLTLAAEEAQQETERLAEDLRRAKNEAADLEKERALLQDRLEAIPAYEPPPAACCALQ